MTLDRAKRITGLDVQLVMADKDCFAEANDAGKIVARVSGKNPKIVLGQLVEEVYAINRQAACDRAGWRCERCGKITGVTAHHKVHRARGQRDDRVENLEVLCMEHHEKEHGG